MFQHKEPIHYVLQLIVWMQNVKHRVLLLMKNININIYVFYKHLHNKSYMNETMAEQGKPGDSFVFMYILNYNAIYEYQCKWHLNTPSCEKIETTSEVQSSSRRLSPTFGVQG